MSDLFNLEVIDKKIKLSLNRNILPEDFDIISKKNSALVYIIGDSWEWSFNKIKRTYNGVFQIKLKEAHSLRKKIENLVESKQVEENGYFYSYFSIFAKTYTERIESKVSYAGCRNIEKKKERKKGTFEKLKEDIKKHEKNLYDLAIFEIIKALHEFNDKRGNL